MIKFYRYIRTYFCKHDFQWSPMGGHFDPRYCVKCGKDELN